MAEFLNEDSGNIWWTNEAGKLHKLDGPAVTNRLGKCSWWINGILIYSDDENNLHKFKELSSELLKSIIRYKLMGPEKGSN